VHVGWERLEEDGERLRRRSKPGPRRLAHQGVPEGQNQRSRHHLLEVPELASRGVRPTQRDEMAAGHRETRARGRFGVALLLVERLAHAPPVVVEQPAVQQHLDLAVREARHALGAGTSDFATTGFPPPVLIPQKLGLGFNKTCRNYAFNF
jgi:hypothetical protein